MFPAPRHFALIFLAVALTATTQASFGISLSPEQQRAFIGAVIHTHQVHIEEQLPRKLAPLHLFKPYFSMTKQLPLRAPLAAGDGSSLLSR